MNAAAAPAAAKAGGNFSGGVTAGSATAASLRSVEELSKALQEMLIGFTGVTVGGVNAKRGTATGFIRVFDSPLQAGNV